MAMEVETEMEMEMEMRMEMEMEMEMQMLMQMRMELEMEMQMQMQVQMQMQMQMEMDMEMDMEMVMVIFGAPKANWEAILGATNASWELRFASKRFLTSDFDVLEASGAPKGDQASHKKLPRSPQEAPKRLLGGALGALGGPKSSPSHDPRYIHRFPSLQEPSRKSPSHDLWALSTF